MPVTMNGRGPAYRIHTERTVLRCWDPADAPLLKEAIDASLDHLRPWMPWAENEPEDLPAKVARLRRFRAEFDLGQNFIYGIFDREERRVLGGTGLHLRVGPGALEIGYWIRADETNQGFGHRGGGSPDPGRLRGGAGEPGGDPLRPGQRPECGRPPQVGLCP